MDLSKLTTADRVILGAAIAYLIFMFLPWYGVDIPGISGGGSYSNSGWDYFLGGILPMILALVMAVHVAITRFAPDTKLPDLPVPWSQVHMFAGIAIAVIVALRLLIGSDEIAGIDTGFDLDRKFGLFLAVLAAIGLAVGGFLKSQEGDTTASAGDPPSAPF